MKKVTQKTISLVLSLAMVFGVFAGLPQTAAQALANHVVINELYAGGGGGSSDIVYNTDYIELYNPTGQEVDLSTWSVQYASATKSKDSNFTGITVLTGTIKAGGYLLIKEGSQGSAGTAMPVSADQTGNISMSASAGKVALVKSTAAIAIPTLPQSNVVDYVGYGTANFFEGSGSAPSPGNANSITRTVAGTDTDDNSADFQKQAPTPQNSASSKDSGIVFTPSAAPDANGFVPSGTTVTLSGAQNGAEIHYRLNSGNEQTYQSPIVITQTTGIKAWFVKDSHAAVARLHGYL